MSTKKTSSQSPAEGSDDLPDVQEECHCGGEEACERCRGTGVLPHPDELITGPMTLVEAELRAMGLDPEEVGRRAEAYVALLMERCRNAPWDPLTLKNRRS